ncbi:MAG: N-6 DNA methylase, partial [Candidatus Eremiobacterota bacterium]
MSKIKKIRPEFYKNFEKLGFYKNDDALFLINSNQNTPPDVKFFLNKAKELNVSAVYFRKQLNGSYQPQVYLYDFTDKDFNTASENLLTDIHKKIWSIGEIPITCFFFKTEIKIIDCTNHITDDYKPSYLIKSLEITEKAHSLYNSQFAIKIKSGVFWEEEEVKNKFKFSNNSSYNKLIENIKYIVEILKKKYNNLSSEFINKLIVQSILIKYLEERIDTNGNKLLSDKYFKQFENSDSFISVLKNGKFVDLLRTLNNFETGFDGNVFQWDKNDQNLLENIDLTLLAELLDTRKTTLASKQLELKFPNWRYFEFKYIPVELISRLYEEFLGSNKKEKGLYFTPAHLTKLLVDECLPLSKYKEINIDTYKVLDPACGSGIFLVTVFKRLVQIWRLQNDMKFPDISVLKNILQNIYGVDYEEQAIELASFSLCLALCNELNPLDIINNLKFDDLREKNLIYSDFFESASKLKNVKFDLIIGNPPFRTGAIKKYSPIWEYNCCKVKIPQGQIALKFLSESIPYLKEKGLLCLIIKSSGLLYNSTSIEYKKVLFSNFNVIQIFDFTALARNNSLWDNGADVASAAIFLKNESPIINNNILHLTFRRTKATKERIVFEIDDYDLHFIDRVTAIENQFIWKNNLLGGGRIKNIVSKYANKDFRTYLKETNCKVEEGFMLGSQGHLCPDYIYEMKTLPTEAVYEDKIDLGALKDIDKQIKFEKIPEKSLFEAPNIIIKENIGKDRIPIHFNKNTFSFQRNIIGISNPNNPAIFNEIINS